MALLRQIGIIIHHVIDVATLSMFDQLSKMEVDSDLEFCMYLRIFSSWCPKNDLHDDDDDHDDNGKFVALWSKAEEGGREGLPPPGPFHAL